jgi:uncharacterized protein
VRPPIDGGTVLITGASAGIGRELARQLAPRAKRLVLAARRKERLEEVREELRRHKGLAVDLVVCDVRDRVSLDDLVDAAGDVDILVNNAGLGHSMLFENAPWEKVAQQIETNITAVTYLTRRLLPGMIARGKGGILNVSSGFGFQFFPGFATYVGTKHFVTGFTESLRLEVAAKGIVVSQLCPGPVSTEFEAISEPIMEPPRFVEISAEACVRGAIRGFERNRAVIIPGFWINVVMGLGALTPRWLLRLVYAPVAKKMRLLSARAAK